MPEPDHNEWPWNRSDRSYLRREARAIESLLEEAEGATVDLRKLVGSSDEAARLSLLFALESVQHARKSLARGIERLQESDDPRVAVPSERQPDEENPL
jgi:hypothetical protein